jgi:uncharacterized protein YndB with AHSA1/START domain
MDSQQSTQIFEITRDFAASPELVWQCWTEPAHMAAWFGPHGFDIPHCTIDARVGGAWLLCMRGTEGEWAGVEHWVTGTYKELTPHSRLVTTDHFADKDGNVVSPSAYGMEGFPEESIITVTLTEQDGGTRMTMTHNVPLELALRFGMDQGWSQSFEKMAAHLAREQSNG